jgi:hypothetical protein
VSRVQVNATRILHRVKPERELTPVVYATRSLRPNVILSRKNTEGYRGL